ncbi:hypothetical protein ABOM_006462 [Aspergillus bombycis]|uniref:Heterokaryon incompatibility domain-containing protein n=1 Tax=Aspergillus bombycis TaxID=109264 RepID=A0A1F8A0P3_9EURO|nr:hypothetical protein ABOM_006462 [Aspergillus bombycis]OGM45294.1 hypothetical protein ABOM_006462 [Aspergillus bombycis]
MASGVYKSLPLGPNTTRMVRLFPNKEKHAEIRCELFTYDLTEIEGGKHLYEALSYVWSGDEEGSAEQRKKIIVHGHTVPITVNLHAALVNLRDRQLERVLWIDAICINQENLDEKSRQIPLMRTIYAQADRVIVWLGDAFEHGDTALETIRDLAKKKAMGGKGSDTKRAQSSSEPCLKLLQRKWFRRIWVLQEAGVARSIEIMCGSIQINGSTFLVYLIRGAQFRPRNDSRLRGSLYIGELIDMYRYHMSSTRHDKIYALLGLTADDPNTPGLKPDYNLPWHQVFNTTIQYILSSEGSVETFPNKEMAIIHTKCWILGYIYLDGAIHENNLQMINIVFNDSQDSVVFKAKWGSNWVIQATAESAESGDILCLLGGSSNPCIIRALGDHFAIINIAITPQQVYQNRTLDTGSVHAVDSRQRPPFDITLTWTIPMSDTENEFYLKGPLELTRIAPHYQKKCPDTEKRLNDLRAIVNGIATQIIQQSEHLHVSPLKRLLAQLGGVIPVSEEVVKMATGDTRMAGPAMLKAIFQYPDNILITEEVVKVAAGNNGSLGSEIMEVLFEYQDNLPITEEVVQAVAQNNGASAYETMEMLLKYRDNVPNNGDAFEISRQCASDRRYSESSGTE